MGVHVQPSNAFAEIDALLDVYEETATYFAIEDGIIMGDFNADCRYLSQKKFEMLSIVIDDRFTFLIDGTMDTTTASSHCTYDRYLSWEVTSHIPRVKGTKSWSFISCRILQVFYLK